MKMPKSNSFRNVYRPVEAGEINRGCGLNVFVEVVTDETRVIEMELDKTDMARVIDPGSEGIYVAVGEKAMLSLRAINCKLSCDAPGCKFASHDFSTQVDGMLEPGQEEGLAVTYATAVLDMSGARAYADMCKTIRTARGH